MRSGRGIVEVYGTMHWCFSTWWSCPPSFCWILKSSPSLCSIMNLCLSFSALSVKICERVNFLLGAQWKDDNWWVNKPTIKTQAGALQIFYHIFVVNPIPRGGGASYRLNCSQTDLMTDLQMFCKFNPILPGGGGGAKHHHFRGLVTTPKYI